MLVTPKDKSKGKDFYNRYVDVSDALKPVLKLYNIRKSIYLEYIDWAIHFYAGDAKQKKENWVYVYMHEERIVVQLGSLIDHIHVENANGKVSEEQRVLINVLISVANRRLKMKQSLLEAPAELEPKESPQEETEEEARDGYDEGD